MTVYPLAAGAVIGVATVAEVVTTNPSNGLVAPLIGAVASVLVAGIAAYAVIRQRRQNAPEDVNAVTVAKTVEANLASFRSEVLTRLDAQEGRIEKIEDHVRPWPKATQ